MSKSLDSNLKGIFGIFDKVLNNFVQVVMLDSTISSDYFRNFANDVTNPYYRRLGDLSIYILSDINIETGEIREGKVFFNEMDYFIDDNVRNLQHITQTLNFLPQGYFRMPKEMQDDIQEQIKDCVHDYVANYLSNDTKMAINEVVSTKKG